MNIFDPAVLEFANTVLATADKFERNFSIERSITVDSDEAEVAFYDYQAKAQEILDELISPFQQIVDRLSGVSGDIESVWVYIEDPPEVLEPRDADFCQVWNDRSPY
jgi:hypothetical protein